MKKVIIALIISLFFTINSTFAAIQAWSPEINVKLESDDSSSYNSSISWVSNSDTLIEFKVQSVAAPFETWNYSVTFPSWFEYISSAISTNDDGTCTWHTTNTLNDSTFSFSIWAIASLCIYNMEVVYKVTSSTTTWDKTISVLDTDLSSNTTSVTVWVTSNNSITAAETQDTDSDWFIDQYKITFASAPTTFSSTNLTIWWITPTLNSISSNIAYLDFTDGTYAGWDKPQILDTDWSMFDTIWVIATNDVTETDKATPIIKEINWTNIVWVWSPSVSFSENSKLSITFSEKVYSTSISSSFVLKENNIDITDSNNITFNESNWDTMYYCIWWYDWNWDCNTPFDSNDTYSIEVWSGVIDLNSNSYSWGSVSVTINVADSTPPTASSVTYNSETNDALVINGNAWSNWYTNSSAWTVNLSILATDNSWSVAEMCISEDSWLTNNNTCDTSWKTYATTSSFTFTWTEWTNTLYIKFKDSAWNISSVSSDSITWDKTDPSSTATPDWGSFQNWSENVTLNCSDTVSSCNKIYYTTDWSAPSTSSTSADPWDVISISWTNETKTLKFFSNDVAWNTEWLTNSKSFIFSTSFVTFTSPTTITNNTSLTLTWTCSNAGWSNAVEVSLNSWAFADVTTDTCDASNTWSTDLTLVANSTNTVETRVKADTSITTSVSVVHDNVAPSSLSMSINWWDAYASSTSATLTISASDSNWTDEMCITESVITNNSTCTWGTWEAYSNSDSFTLSSGDATKTVFIKFRDEALNVSSVINDTIILEATTPSLSSDISTGSYSSSQSVTLTSSSNIYYTTDWSNPTSLSTLYTSALSFWSSAWTETLKAIAISNSWLSSSVDTFTYTFACSPSSVTNWIVGAYPTCTISCSNWFSLSWSSCVSWSSGWGWGGWWGSSVVNWDYENVKLISEKEITIEEEIKDEIIKKYWILDLTSFNNKEITWKNWILNLRASLKSKSNIIIPQNTQFYWDAKTLQAPYSMDVVKDLKVRTLKINNKDLKSYNIKKLFFIWNEEESISFNNNIEINLQLGGKIDWKVYIYHSNKKDWNFSLLKSKLENDSEWNLSFKTNKLWYFAVIRDIYINRYFWKQVVSTVKIDTKNETKNTVTELKSQIKNKSVERLITTYSTKLVVPEMDYYASFDPELRSKYEKIKEGYKNFILNTDKYLTTKDKQFQLDAAEAFKELNKFKELKNFDEKYVVKKEVEWLEVYETTYTPIKHLVDKLEWAMLVKFEKLKTAWTISKEKYDQSIKDYNDFILHLSIYRQYGNKESAQKALVPGRRFLKVFKTRVGSTTVKTNTEVQKTEDKKVALIKDKYNFPSELRFWNYNNEVKNLQEIMKSYGYFNYSTTTQYFWTVTRNSLINFSKDILKTPNSSWVLTRNLIEKLYNLELK